MKILIVPSWYPTKYDSINGSFFKEQAEALASSGLDVSVIAIHLISIRDWLQKKTQNKLFKIYKERVNFVDTYSIDILTFGLSNLNILHILYSLVLKLVYMKMFNKNNKPDIIHAHSYKYAGYACTKLFKNLPVVVTEHVNTITDNFLTKSDKKMLEYTVCNSDIFITVSNILKNKILNLFNFNKNICVIPNLVSSVFESKKVYNEENIFTFCSVSSLDKNKSVDILIKAFYKAFNNIEKVILKIAGEGDERILLNDLINKYHLNNRVELLGQLEREDIAKLYNTSNAFAMVSKSETFGLVYAESLMCGLPTIGTYNGGAEDILNCYGGYLCEVDNVDDIANKMTFVYNNYNMINNKKIHVEAKKRFSKEVVVKKIKNLYIDTIKFNNKY